MSQQQIAEDGPVTVQVSRTVKPGCEANYEKALKHLTRTARNFTGFQGANFLRPSGEDSREYVTIFRFDSYENLRAWETSFDRAFAMEALCDLVEGETKVVKTTGLEFWFTPPKVTLMKPPSPHKMMVVVTAMVFLIALCLKPILDILIPNVHWVVRVAVIAVLQVGLMTYVFMPRVTQFLSKWLYPK